MDQIILLFDKWLTYKSVAFLLQVLSCHLTNRISNDLSKFNNNKNLHNDSETNNTISKIDFTDITFTNLTNKIVQFLINEYNEFPSENNFLFLKSLLETQPELLKNVDNSKVPTLPDIEIAHTSHLREEKRGLKNLSIHVKDTQELSLSLSTEGNSTIFSECMSLNYAQLEKLVSLSIRCESLVPHQDFIITKRNRYVPKGTSPIMLIRDKLSVFPQITAKEIIHKVIPTYDLFNSEQKKEITKFSKEQCLWRMDKSFFIGIKVIGQLDRKYILCESLKQNQNSKLQRNLIIFDQHAVDERVQLEKLMSKYIDINNGGNFIVYILKEFWILITMTKTDVKNVIESSPNFMKYGLNFSEISSQTLAVTSIPEFLHWIALRRTNNSCEYYNFIWDFVNRIIAEQLTNLFEMRSFSNIVPNILYQYFCKEACLCAINFGEELSNSVCEEMIKNLATCLLPFMCAHGRPLVCCFQDEIYATKKPVLRPTLAALKHQ